MDQSSDGIQPKGAGRPRTDLNLYLTVAAPIFFALFFLEYPPLFLIGYWSWSAVVHKTLSGIFLILNLAIAEYAVRRSRSRSRAAEAAMKNREEGGEAAPGEPPLTQEGPPGSVVANDDPKSNASPSAKS